MKQITATLIAGIAKTSELYETLKQMLGGVNQWILENFPLKTQDGGTGATSFPAGRVLYGGGDGPLASSDNFFYDAATARVGVRTKTPAAEVHLVSAENASEGVLIENTSAAGVSAAALLELLNAAATIGALYSHGPAKTTTRCGLTLANWIELLSAGASSNGLLIDTNGADPVVIGTNNTERMRVQPGGNVSIGTTADRQPLSVNGTIESMAAGFKFPDGSVQATAGVTGSSNTGRVAYWSSSTSITGEAAFFWDAGTNRLGVNKAAPSCALDVVGAGGTAIDALVNGNIASGDASKRGAFCAVDGAAATQAAFGQDSASTAGLWGVTAGWCLRYDIANGGVALGGAPQDPALGSRLKVYGGVFATLGWFRADGGYGVRVSDIQVLTNQQAGIGASLASRTAGATYGANEQLMSQESHDKVRKIEAALKVHGMIAT